MFPFLSYIKASCRESSKKNERLLIFSNLLQVDLRELRGVEARVGSLPGEKQKFVEPPSPTKEMEHVKANEMETDLSTAMNMDTNNRETNDMATDGMETE